MNCRRCNTTMRTDRGDRPVCPNCGYVSSEPSFGRKRHAERAGEEPKPDPPAEDPAVQSALEEKLENDLKSMEESILLQEEVADPKESEMPEPANATPPPDRKGDSSASLSLAPAGVRDQLSRQPELLEPGLILDTRVEGAVGVLTPVGPIDLLARDENGAVVVVILVENEPGPELVSDLLQRMGWARKNVAPDEEVRGIALLASPGQAEAIGYAAAAVTGSLSFKTYKMTLAFEDLDV